MQKIKKCLFLIVMIIVASCSSTQSLQEYYVDHSENPNFLAFDIPTGILDLDTAQLTPEQRIAFESVRKLNILAFKKTLANAADYKAESAIVRKILANERYTELLKMNTSFGKATVRYKGEETAIDEVLIFGDNKEKGFALVRVLGKDMSPAHFVQLLQAVQKSDFNREDLGDLGKLFQ